MHQRVAGQMIFVFKERFFLFFVIFSVFYSYGIKRFSFFYCLFLSAHRTPGHILPSHSTLK